MKKRCLYVCLLFRNQNRERARAVCAARNRGAFLAQVRTHQACLHGGQRTGVYRAVRRHAGAKRETAAGRVPVRTNQGSDRGQGLFVFSGECKPKIKYRLTIARKYGLIASDKNCSGRGQHESTRNENRAEIGIYRQGNLLCRTFCGGNCNHGADIHSDAGRRSDDDADIRGHARGDCTGREALDGFDRHLSHPRRGRRARCLQASPADLQSLSDRQAAF